MLISISDVLETPVSIPLGETVTENAPQDIQSISEKLEIINLQLARQKAGRRTIFHGTFILLGVSFAVIFILIGMAGSPYLYWDYSNPETAVAGIQMEGVYFEILDRSGYLCGSVFPVSGHSF